MIFNVAVSLLLVFSSLGVGHGASGPCSEPLKNIAVYEGALNTLIYFPAGPTGVRWSVISTTDELTEVDIVYYNDAVVTFFTEDYAFNSSGLIIKNATTTADYSSGHHTSTAGLYTAECFGGSLLLSLKFLVVRQGPTCSCSLVNPSSVQLTCSAIYADSSFDPIAAVFTLYVNGSCTTSDTPARISNHDGYTWYSTSTFTTAYSSSSTYQCGLTFDQPTEIQDPSVARNAPTFNHYCSVTASEFGCTAVTTISPSACPSSTITTAGLSTTVSTTTTTPNAPTTSTSSTATTVSEASPSSSTTTAPSTTVPGAIDPCSVPLENIAVYEGHLNTFIYFPARPNGVRWTLFATSDELTPIDIVNYTDTVNPSYTADYAFDPQQGLTIKNATILPDYYVHQLSTAGLYIAECVGGNQFSSKFLVVRQGPTCSCGLVNTLIVQLTCSASYADSTYNPIAAIFTLYVNGSYTTSDTPQRTSSFDGYAWISTSTFTTAYSSSSTYQCGLTFSQPTEIRDPSIAMNAPTFNDYCSVTASEFGCTADTTTSPSACPSSITTTARLSTTSTATATNPFSPSTSSTTATTTPNSPATSASSSTTTPNEPSTSSSSITTTPNPSSISSSSTSTTPNAPSTSISSTSTTPNAPSTLTSSSTTTPNPSSISSSSTTTTPNEPSTSASSITTTPNAPSTPTSAITTTPNPSSTSTSSTSTTPSAPSTLTSSSTTTLNSPASSTSSSTTILSVAYPSASTTLSPYTTAFTIRMEPLFGPVAGGTTITITPTGSSPSDHPPNNIGSYIPDIRDARNVYIGNDLQSTQLMMASDGSTYYVLEGVTPNTTEASIGQHLPITIEFSSNIGRFNVTYNQTFTYLPNPSITLLYPNRFIVSGGTLLDVTGRSLSSVAKPVIQLKVVISREAESSARSSTYKRDCTVPPGNDTYMQCPMPPLSLPEDFLEILNSFYNASTLRKRRSRDAINHLIANSHSHLSRMKRYANVLTVTGPNGIDIADIYLGFILDGYKEYENINDVLPDTKFIFYSAPEINSPPDLIEFDPFVDALIYIKGRYMMRGCLLRDYVVYISNQTCTNNDLQDNQLSCRPPKAQPSSTRNDTKYCDQHLSITITVGYKQYQYACLTYEDRSRRIALIVGLTVGLGGFVILLIVLIVCIVGCRRKKRSQQTYRFQNFQEQELRNQN